jgi:hypothetical protein
MAQDFKTQSRKKCISLIILNVGLVGLWCLTPLSTIFQLYGGGFKGGGE